MATIKPSGHGLAVTATRQIRAASLAEQRPNDEWRRRADTIVGGVDDLLLVIDRDRVPLEERAHLVATAAKDSGSIYSVAKASIHAAGDGCKAQLPGAEDAGFQAEDTVSLHTADHLLLVTDRSRTTNRLAEDLVSIRRDQADD